MSYVVVLVNCIFIDLFYVHVSGRGVCATDECGGQDNLRELAFFLHIWVLGMELRSLSLVPDALYSLSYLTSPQSCRFKNLIRVGFLFNKAVGSHMTRLELACCLEVLTALDVSPGDGRRSVEAACQRPSCIQPAAVPMVRQCHL